MQMIALRHRNNGSDARRAFSGYRRPASILKTPLISDCAGNFGEDRVPGQHEAELFDEWPQSDCGHVGDEFVEHAALTEDGVGASLSGVGFEVAVVAKRL